MIFLLIIVYPYIHLPLYYVKRGADIDDLKDNLEDPQDLIYVLGLGFSGVSNSFLILVTSLD